MNRRGKRKVVIGATYRHCDGLRYRALQVLPDATGYEATRSAGRTVVYEQLEAGTYPAGTVWTRSEADFLGQTNVGGTLQNTFEQVRLQQS